MSRYRRPGDQRGYLYEVPLLLMLVVLAVSLILPHLPVLGQKILLGMAALPVLLALYYMLVIPGWMPADRRRLRWPWNIVTFVALASMIVLGVVGFVFSADPTAGRV